MSPAERERGFLRQAIVLMTEAQMHQSWVREQEYNRAHGLPYYQRLVEPRTGRVIREVP